MADSERTRADEGVPGQPPKRREELDQLLQRIAAHIAEVDKDGTTTANPTAGETSKAPPTGEAPQGAAPTAVSNGEIGVSDSPSPRRVPSGSEPPALRSALPANRKIARAEEAGPATNERHAVQSPPGVAPESVADEPWDRDAAEALTKTYEADAAVPPLRSMLDLMSSKPNASAGDRRAGDRRRVGSERGGAAATVEEDPHEGQVQFIEAARRVEAMLDRLAPREAVDALNERFTTLEGAVRQNGDQLERLDGIEARLAELGAKLTDEQVVALFGSLVPTADELAQFADDAAGRAAERVLEAHAQELSAQPSRATGAGASNIGPDIKALNQMLAAFMDERRRTDAGTQEALETLQLAMQHVLDRIDSAEAAAATERAAAPKQDAQPPALMTEAYDSQFDAPDRMPAPTGRAAANLSASPEDRLQNPEPERASGAGEPILPPAMQGTRLAGDKLAAGGRQEGTTLAPPESREAAAPVSDRQAFIAMARRAAEKAKAEADNAARGAAEKTGKWGDKREKNPDIAGVAGKLTSGVRPAVAIVALGAILLAGFWFLAGPKLGLSRGTVPVTVERSVAPPSETRPAKGAQPDVEPEAAAPAPAELPAPQPKKISNEIEELPVQDRQEANATIPPAESAGPGIAVALSETPATIDQVMQARERARLADLSQRTAFAAARSHPVPNGASPIETASIPASNPPASSQPQEQRADQGRQLVLPPAAAGPLSLRLAASQGDASAQLEIATRLAEGRGIKQDFAEAAVWYERAAAQGEAVAQYRLATLLERGMGMKADRARARALYEEAAEQGNLKAMHNLAVMSANPTAGAPDYVSAAALFIKAAGHGLADSQYNLGVLYESGLGVPKDHAAAYKWYSLAAKAGDQDAGRRRDMLISRLPAQTIQAMESQISTWRPTPANERANNVRVAGEAWKQRSVESRR